MITFDDDDSGSCIDALEKIKNKYPNENIIFYGNNNYRSAKSEITINWNDPELNIKWPKGKKIISMKDKKGKTFKEYRILK